MNKGKNAEEKKTRSLRIMNMHIPYHILMVIWSFISIFPLWFLVINTFKVKKEIYLNFFGLPQKWTLENYQSLLGNSDFFAYFRNSFLVVVVSLFMILLLGSLCAFALAHWRTKTSRASTHDNHIVFASVDNRGACTRKPTPCGFKILSALRRNISEIRGEQYRIAAGEATGEIDERKRCPACRKRKVSRLLPAPARFL